MLATYLGYGAATRLLVNRGVVVIVEDNYRHITRDIAKERGLEYTIKALKGEKLLFIIYRDYMFYSSLEGSSLLLISILLNTLLYPNYTASLRPHTINYISN
jgi:hypothetical protein